MQFRGNERELEKSAINRDNQTNGSRNKCSLDVHYTFDCVSNLDSASYHDMNERSCQIVKFKYLVGNGTSVGFNSNRAGAGFECNSAVGTKQALFDLVSQNCAVIEGKRSLQ